jgi:hypothetical protein
MRRTLWVVAGVATLAMGASDSARAQGQPKIDIPETRHDFGRVFERKQYVHDFIVYNRGDAELEIKNVRPTCGCTVTNYDKTIAPGKQGKIEFVLDGEKVHDEFNKNATVSSNDPVSPTMTIAVSGIEVPYLDIQPEGTVYLHGRHGEQVVKTMTVKTNEDISDFKITRVSSNIDDKITYTVKPSSMPGAYDVTVYKNPNLPTLITYGNIYLHTNSSVEPTTPIQVHVVTKGDITVSPTMVNFGPVRFADTAGSGQEVTRAIIVSKSSGKFAVKDVEFNNPNFRASVAPVTDGLQYRVEVTFKPPLKSNTTQSETAEMIIHTSDAGEPAIRVQVSARAM